MKKMQRIGARSLLVVTCVASLSLSMPGAVGLAIGSSAATTDLQRFYEKKEYQKVVEEIGKLGPEQSASPDVRRIKIRSLLNLGKPKEAMAEYDQLELGLKQDELPLLREVSLGFIIVMMKDMREQMRGAAYTALKEWNSAEAIPFLEDGLSDGSGIVRALAAEGLGKLEEGRRSVRFRQALDDQAALVKEAVLKGLAKSGDASVVGMVEPALKDSEARVRVAAAEVLCRFGRSPGCDLLQQSGRALNPDERTSAIRALVDLQGPKVSPILIEASKDKQPSVRGAAATGLGHVPTQEALAALTRLLKDPLPPVRIAAVVSLGLLRGLDTIPPLRTAIEDQDASVRAFVIGALLAQGERYDVLADPISTLSHTKEPAIRTAIARALGYASEIDREPARSSVTTLAQDSVPRVRIAAFKSMAKLEGMKGLVFLKRGLHDEDDAVRTATGGALLQISPLKK